MAILGSILIGGKSNLTKFVKDKNFGWKEYLGIFWFISLIQTLVLYILSSSGVSQLSGFPTKFSLKRFKLPKQDNADDIKTLIFTPRVTRETIILAKFAAIFTYFFAINLLLLTLPLFFYFLTFLSLLAALSFLLLNGFIFVLANFFLVVPCLFYFYENYSIMSVMVFIFSILFLELFLYFFWKHIIKYSFILPIAFIPLFALVGYLFYSLYRKKFLKKDLS